MEYFVVLCKVLEGRNITVDRGAVIKSPYLRFISGDDISTIDSITPDNEIEARNPKWKEAPIATMAAASDTGCELTIELIDEITKKTKTVVAEINVRIDNSPNWNTPKDVWLPLHDPPSAQQKGSVTGQLRFLIQTIPYKLTTPEKQGYLNKKEKSGLFTSFKQYWFYLHEGNLFYLKYSKPCGFIHLSSADIEKSTNKKKKFAFEIGTSQYGHKLEVLYAKNEKEMDEWMTATRKVTNRKPFVFAATPQIVKEKTLEESKVEKPKKEPKKKEKREKEEKKAKKEKKSNKEKEQIVNSVVPSKKEKNNEKKLDDIRPSSPKPSFFEKLVSITSEQTRERSRSVPAKVTTPALSDSEDDDSKRDNSDDEAEEEEEEEDVSPVKRKEPFVVKSTIKNDGLFKGAGVRLGLDIWRIEKLLPIPYDKKLYGQFAAEDSYIVLNTAERPDGKLSWDIHYWLGSKTQIDKSACAAIRAVQLNDHLEGQSVHHREVQSHESEKFLAYFENEIKYLEGGVESGFRHVVKGEKTPRLMKIFDFEVTGLRADLSETSVFSMNKKDSFVLDTGLELYIWNGPESSKIKRMKALEISHKLNSENNSGKGKVISLSDKSENAEKFWEIIGGAESEIGEEVKNEEQEETEEEEEDQLDWLYRVSHVDGDVQVTPLEEEILSKDMLDSNACFVLDCATEIFIWNGKYANLDEKKAAVMLAEEFLGMFERAPWTPITRVFESAETVLFKQRFVDWIDIPVRVVQKSNIAGSREQHKVDTLKMFNTIAPKAEKIAVEAESDVLEVWTIENGAKASPVTENEFGTFYSNKSYICLFSYLESPKSFLKSIAYFWEGLDAKANNFIAYKFGFYDILVKRMEEEGGSKPTQIRVYQGKESDHFLEVFNKKDVIAIRIPETLPYPHMYQVQLKGTKPDHSSAIQLEKAECSRLSSQATFVIQTETKSYVWLGKGSVNEERDYGVRVANKFSENIQNVEEGQEPKEFWDAIGGKTEYASSDYLQSTSHPIVPRLFQCSNASGVVEVEEIHRFNQKDLNESDVFILDVYHEIFVWEGSNASAAEKEMAKQVAQDYIVTTSTTDGRPLTTPITILQAKKESLQFKCHFHGWSNTAQSFKDIYAQQKVEREKGFALQPESPLVAELKAASAKRAQHV